MLIWQQQSIDCYEEDAVLKNRMREDQAGFAYHASIVSLGARFRSGLSQALD
jgi:hypothetical protein